MNATHLIIFNRSAALAADGWIHIVPRGELPNREAGLVQVLDDAALDSILANLRADQSRLGDKWPGLYGGREHFIYNAEQDSAALAWFKDFEKRSDGIWAKVDGLTDIGREAIVNKRYKFTSFVADRRDTQELPQSAIRNPQSAIPKRVRILKIDTIGFTNQANGKELLTPIMNREDGTIRNDDRVSEEPGEGGRWITVRGNRIFIEDGESLDKAVQKHFVARRKKKAADKNKDDDWDGGNDSDDEEQTKHKIREHDFMKSADLRRAKMVKNTFAGADASAGNQKQNKGQHMKSVCTLLGLSAEADESSVHASVTKLINRADTAEAALAPLKNRSTELETRNSELLNEQCEALLDAHGVKEEKLRNRARACIASLQNRDERIAWLTDFGFKPVEAGKGRAVILNRAAGKAPGSETVTQSAGGVTPQQLNSEVRKLMNRDGLQDFTQGFNALRQERPELFASAQN